MNNRFISLIAGFGVTVMLFIILVFAHTSMSAAPEEHITWLRILTLLGADMPLGLIQAFTFFLFFYAVIEMILIGRKINAEKKAFSEQLLPEKENWILSPGEVAQLKLEVIGKTKSSKSILSSLIIMVCNKFRANKSTSESLEVLASQVKINKENDESEQSVIRYASWAIPSVGFIGTVIGIAGSLGAVRQNMSSDDLLVVTQSLNVAFDTTLLALFLSLILMFMFHRFQEKVDKFHASCEQYVMDNLINRIYHNQ